MEERESLGLRPGRAEYSSDYSSPGPAGRKKKAQRFNAGNIRPRRVPSGTTEAHDRGAILSSLRDLPCLRIGVPALKRWAILARPFGTETPASPSGQTHNRNRR